MIYALFFLQKKPFGGIIIHMKKNSIKCKNVYGGGLIDSWEVIKKRLKFIKNETNNYKNKRV